VCVAYLRVGTSVVYRLETSAVWGIKIKIVSDRGDRGP
jgi:hypothetical protein